MPRNNLDWNMDKEIVDEFPFWEITLNDISKVLNHINSFSNKQEVEQFEDWYHMEIALFSIPSSEKRREIIKALLEKKLALSLITKKELDKAIREFQTKDNAFERQKKNAAVSNMLLSSVPTVVNPNGSSEPFIVKHNFLPELLVVFPEKGEMPARVVKFTNFIITERKLIVSENKDTPQASELTIQRLRDGFKATNDNIDKIKDNIVEAKVMIKASALVSMLYFKKEVLAVFNGALIYDITNNGVRDLNMLWEYVTDKDNVPLSLEKLINSYGFDMDGDTPYFHHSIRVDGGAVSETLLPEGARMNHSLSYGGASFRGLWSVPAAVNEEKAKEILEEFFELYSSMYNFRKAISCLGWVITGLLKDRIRHFRSNFTTPILYMWGPQNIGKTALIKTLFNLMGWAGASGKGEEMGFKEASDATIRDMLTSYNAPILVGEFKNDGSRHASNMETRMLAVYDHMSSGKKQHDGNDWKQGAVVYKASLAMLSNDAISDAPVRSRLMELAVTLQDKLDQTNPKAFSILKTKPIGWVGTVIVHWVLNNWDKIEEHIEKAEKLIEGIEIDDRSRYTLLSIAIGLLLLRTIMGEHGVSTNKLRDDIIESACREMTVSIGEHTSETPDKDFCNWVVEQIHSSNRNIPLWTTVDTTVNGLSGRYMILPVGVLETYLKSRDKVSNISARISELKQSLIKNRSEIYSIGRTKHLVAPGGNKDSKIERLFINTIVASEAYSIDRSAFDPINYVNLGAVSIN